MNYQTIIRWYIVSKHSEYTEFLERKLQLWGKIQFECCLTLLSWTPQIIGFYLYIFFMFSNDCRYMYKFGLEILYSIQRW